MSYTIYFIREGFTVEDSLTVPADTAPAQHVRPELITRIEWNK